MSRQSPPLPIVAIVGRPNVGKSTLFNRWAGARRALVEDTPGLTRDRITAEVELAGRRLVAVDTAGLDPDAEAGLSRAVQAQARTAIAEADAIVLVVDGQAGLLPEDERIARTLRRTAKPVALAVNKIDHPQHLARVGEFHRLGLEPTLGVSATHGSNAFDLLEQLVAKLPPPPEESEDAADTALRLAVVGRPNVGKSSLVNRLLGADRVVVSAEPGTTRDSIDTRLERDGQAWVIVDTAGLRRAGRRHTSAERGGALMAVRALERADVALLVVDAAEGATDQDARVAGLVRERGRPALIVANKWDLVKPREGRGGKGALDVIRERLRFLAEAPAVAVSARTGSGVDRLFPQARKLVAASQRRVPTAELNRWLADVTERHQPALGTRGTHRRPLRFFYATQTAVAPPTFVLFCTEPSAIKESYRRYLENRLREAFDLEGVPLRLRLRSRHRTERA
jgi:GTP-binding protein